MIHTEIVIDAEFTNEIDRAEVMNVLNSILPYIADNVMIRSTTIPTKRGTAHAGE